MTMTSLERARARTEPLTGYHSRRPAPVQEPSRAVARIDKEIGYLERAALDCTCPEMLETIRAAVRKRRSMRRFLLSIADRIAA